MGLLRMTEGSVSGSRRLNRGLRSALQANGDAVEARDNGAPVRVVGPPAPAAGIEVPVVSAVAVLPAQVQGRKHADDDLEQIGVLECLVEGRARTHRHAEYGVRLPLRTDGESAHQEIPHVAQQVIFKSTRIAVEKETAGAGKAIDSANAAVRSGDDDRGQLAGRDGLVQRHDHVVQEVIFILGERRAARAGAGTACTDRSRAADIRTGLVSAARRATRYGDRRRGCA